MISTASASSSRAPSHGEPASASQLRALSSGGSSGSTDRTASKNAARLAYSVDEAASLTGLSRDLLYDEMRGGHLGYLKVGRRRLITRQQLEQFLGIIPRQPSRADVTERKAANGGP